MLHNLKKYTTPIVSGTLIIQEGELITRSLIWNGVDLILVICNYIVSWWLSHEATNV